MQVSNLIHCSFNGLGYYVRELCKSDDMIARQETWHLSHDVSLIGTLITVSSLLGNQRWTPQPDRCSGDHMEGWPSFGEKVCFRRLLYCRLSVRLSAVKMCLVDHWFLVFSVYM